MTTPSFQARTRAALWISGIAVGALAVVTTGCTPAPAGEPPNSTPASSSATPLPSSRPPVPRPLNSEAYRTKPCALFTDEQAKVLGYVKPGSPEVQPELARCSWRGENIGESDLNVNYYPATDLLGQIYRRETTSWPSNSMRPLTIAGQPALTTTFPTTELCRVALGLTDSQGIEIRVADKHVNSCDRAMQIAETIIHNLGG